MKIHNVFNEVSEKFWNMVHKENQKIEQEKNTSVRIV